MSVVIPLPIVEMKMETPIKDSLFSASVMVSVIWAKAEKGLRLYASFSLVIVFRVVYGESMVKSFSVHHCFLNAF